MFNKVDYTAEGFILPLNFIVPIERDDIKGYASVNAEFYREEDGLDRTGNFFVYLLHPTMGSANFVLEPVGHDWDIKSRPFWLTEDIIQEITKAIESKKGNVKAN